MSPLSAIPNAMPAYGLPPAADLIAPGRIPTEAPGTVAPARETDPAGSFGSVLGRMVNEVNQSQLQAQDAIHSLQSGGNVSLHQAVIAMEEASISFQLMVEVRNRLLESYQEVMRMQV
jgi:flagellar hook-basal body complex protein FliE